MRWPSSVLAALLTFGSIGAILLALGRRDYPDLHTILDTGICVLAGILTMLLWDIGARTQRPFPQWLAISFGVAALSELIHALVTVEWFGMLAPIAHAQGVLRPATWQIPAYVRPVGIGWSIWLLLRCERRAWAMLPVLLILSAVLFPLFYGLPRYTTPIWLDITRPWLIGVPLMWAGIAWSCWRYRAADRLLPTVGLMAGVLLLAHLCMLYSRAAHDTQAMVAHLGKIAGFLVLLFSLMRMAASDMRERIEAEQALAQLNQGLERRVAERTPAETALGESEAKYRMLFDTLIEGFCTIEMIFDTVGQPVDYRFLELNPAFESQTGLHHAQGRSMRELAPEHEAHWFEIYGKVALTGEPVRFENAAKALGRYFDVCAYRIGEPGSHRVAILFNDITARKLAEREANARLARLALLNQITRAIGERQDLPSILQVVVRTLEDELPIDFGCVCLYDALDAILTVTCVGVHSAGLAMELGMPEHMRIAIDQNGLARCVRGQLVYEPQIDQVHFPFPQRLATGGLRALVVAPLQVESKVFGVLIAARREAHSFSSGECEFLRQLSEHVGLAAHQAETHAALQRAYDDLRQSQQAVMQQERLRALGQMASGIAHDINNAISPVALYTESLLEHESQLSSRAREHLQTIQRAIDDVAQTVERLREFYRHREPQLILAPVQMNRLVQQVVDLTRARWNDMPQQRGIVIQMQIELAPDLPVIRGVESELREALINLIFNAVDAMPQGGVLGLHTGVISSEPHVYVEVRDSGMGMDESTRRRCMEPFFTTKGERGTGLGLAMVYGVIQRHSAEIEIESAPGQGTSVRLKFPAQADFAQPIESIAGQRAPPHLHILVIDDDPLLLKSLRDTLEAEGHTIVTANGGQEGIDTFTGSRASTFDVVISDLGMPYIDGCKVAEAIKKSSSSTPIILLTGWGQRLLAEDDIPPHVDRVVSKPPRLRQLREALAQLCGSIT